jgi:cysteinyl-tRNA synthetase
MLQVYNTLTKQKEAFKPIKPGEVKMYVCGMTVYDYCHIGHGRIFVVFDVIFRYLRFLGYKVTYVRNITDVDDKIIQRAEENGEEISKLTERTIKAMHEDEHALDVLQPTHVPRATEYMTQIINMITTLVSKGYAYTADNGDVYFDIKKFSSYGELSHQDLEKLRAGIRVEVVDAKRDPLDFVLWKLAKPGEPKWSSPWGEGRPGWHIECSVMSNCLLGEHFDIHGGGLDLQFPHHQNEIAQSEAANGCKFTNYWLHVGYVNIDKEKMSKSLGNFFTIKDVLKDYEPEVIRYFLLASHYRSPINYSQQNLQHARQALSRFYSALRNLPEAAENNDNDFQQKFIEAMSDDFNTPIAFAVLFDLVREINRLKDEDNINEAASLGALLKRLGNTLGILQSDPEQYLRGLINPNEKTEIEELILARNQARAEKNWAEADRIRLELQARGIIIEDGPQGTTWRLEFTI